MKTNIITIILLVFISINIFAQDNKLYIYWPDFDKDETICGYVDSNGEIVIPAGKYADIFTAEFDKVAIVKIKGKKEFEHTHTKMGEILRARNSNL